MIATRECCVCFEETKDTVVPCRHPVCRTCMESWLSRLEEPTCPACRGVVVQSPVDFECLQLSTDCKDASFSVTVDFPTDGSHVGVTFSNVDGGVRVRAIHECDRGAQCGLKQGDVVTHINGLVVKNHHTAIAIVNRATSFKVPLQFVVSSRRSSWSFSVASCLNNISYDCNTRPHRSSPRQRQSPLSIVDPYIH